MTQQKDLELVLNSRTPLVVIETDDEARVLDSIATIARARRRDDYLPLFRWTITDGLQRVDIDLAPQPHNADPEEVLRHIRAVTKPGIYVLLDFHPFLDDPVKIRLLKDICLRFDDVSRHLILISHRIELPDELSRYAASFDIPLPGKKERQDIVRRVLEDWVRTNRDRRIEVDPHALGLLVANLAGLSHADTARLARNAVQQDGAITRSDLPAVMQAKYELLNRSGILQYEYDTATFADIGGFRHLKRWLVQRRSAYAPGASGPPAGLDPPKGLLLTGVQGCGKSLAAKATAGVFGLPLLRLDFAALYNKYHGETERNLRESLQTADTMAPCVLWIDEIEKGLAGRGGETGTSRRVLGTFLTWLAERRRRVFVVATANDINALPPELVRKGRFDEIFFVDLPGPANRRAIFEIHLESRDSDPAAFDLDRLADAAEGYSGAEIEQVVVAALYAVHGTGETLSTAHLLAEIAATRPLSVVMAERIAGLRRWANGRTVPCD